MTVDTDGNIIVVFHAAKAITIFHNPMDPSVPLFARTVGRCTRLKPKA